MKLLFLIILLTGCSIGAIRKHNPHFKTTRIIEAVNKKFYVGNITHIDENKKNDPPKRWGAGKKKKIIFLNQTSLYCRATSFNMPNGITVRSYIKNALTDELDAAQSLENDSQKINIIIHRLENDSSSISKGKWFLDIEYKLQKENKRIKTKTEFESAFSGNIACKNAADYLTEALSDNFNKLFKALSD